ncbi:helix-turn-helix domain-containing protein [Paenibacillus crassostreae]|nr:helix-turn-helix domain-containing protein [Paenibacillus crassostreae]
MSTKQERQLVIEKSEKILDCTIKQLDLEFYHAFSNVLHDYIMVTNPSKNIDKKMVLSELIFMMAEDINRAEPLKSYTTGELARIFGVSVQAINKWIDEGRFLGYKRMGGNRHNRIPDSLSYTTRTGEVISIREVAAMYNTHNQSQDVTGVNPQEHRDAVIDEITRFMRKYGGTYEMTLGTKGERTVPEDRDSSIWIALLDELRDINEA